MLVHEQKSMRYSFDVNKKIQDDRFYNHESITCFLATSEQCFFLIPLYNCNGLSYL